MPRLTKEDQRREASFATGVFSTAACSCVAETLRRAREARYGRQLSEERAGGAAIGTLKAPKAGVAIVAAIGPHKRQTKPDAFDKASSGGAAHSGTGTNRALLDFLGESELHEIEVSPGVKEIMSSGRVGRLEGKRARVRWRFPDRRYRTSARKLYRSAGQMRWRLRGNEGNLIGGGLKFLQGRPITTRR
jgi:hypothetical protein